MYGKTKVIFKVDPSKGMVLEFVTGDKVTRVVEAVDFRMFDLVIWCDNPIAIPPGAGIDYPDSELMQEKSQDEQDKLFDIFKVH